MLKNNELRKLIIILCFIAILLIFSSFITTNLIINNYRNYFIDYNAKVINAIEEKYPGSTTDVIDIIVNSKNHDKTNLNKYGITNDNLVNKIENLTTQYNKTFNIIVILIFSIFLVLTSIILTFMIVLYRKIRKLNEYTLGILDNKTQLDIIDNSEGDISILKNHLYDITRLLKENNNLLEHDKLYLKDALADISHQIRTPLTSLYLFNEILYKEDDKEKQRVFLDKMKNELERIEWLVTSLLKISKIDSGTISFKNEKIDVNKLLDDVLTSLSSMKDKKKIKININSDEKVYINGDYNWLKEALINITKNCTEHVSKKGIIDINYKDNPLYIEITIKDNGEGIDKKDLPHIFERFYKANNSTKESIGIGLSLSKSIINKHNGDIMVKSKKGEYTIFTIKIYKA